MIPSGFRWLLLGLLLAALSGCEMGVSWDRSEKENARHIFESLDQARLAASRANQLERNWEPGGESVEPVIEALDNALIHASQVRSSVLTKAHPNLGSRFRLEYVRSIRDLRTYYQSGELDGESDPRQTLGEFTDWFYTNQHEFRWWRSYRDDLDLN